MLGRMFLHQDHMPALVQLLLGVEVVGYCTQQCAEPFCGGFDFFLVAVAAAGAAVEVKAEPRRLNPAVHRFRHIARWKQRLV